MSDLITKIGTVLLLSGFVISMLGVLLIFVGYAVGEMM